MDSLNRVLHEGANDLEHSMCWHRTHLYGQVADLHRKLHIDTPRRNKVALGCILVDLAIIAKKLDLTLDECADFISTERDVLNDVSK